MIWSKYNLLYKKRSSYFSYNSLSNSFIEIDLKTFNTLKRFEGYVEVEDKLNELNDKELIRLLIQKKFIVNNDWEDINLMKLEANLKRFDNKTLSLTIAPTSYCNFNCPYCYEGSRPNIYMNKETEKNLIEFVLNNSNVEYVDITWYGGEPLLNFKTIKSITKSLLKKFGNKYSASVITNGYLLNHDKIIKLKSLHIDKLQITIDGIGERHNTRRPHIKGYNTFKKIIENLHALFEHNPSINVSIRVNLDNDNKYEFIEISNYINTQFKGRNIFVSPGFIDNPNGACNDLTGCTLMSRDEKHNFFFEIYEKFGLQLDTYYPDNSKSECIARSINGFVIGANGDVYKCYNDIGIEEKAIFNINTTSKRNVIIESMYLTGADPYSNSECLDCEILPICSGGCPYVRIEHEYYGKEKTYCSKFKDNLVKYLDYEYKTSINT